MTRSSSSTWMHIAEMASKRLARQIQISRSSICSTRRFIPAGHARRLYPIDLLHNDTGTRPLESDNKAAHIRLRQRLLAMPPTRLQHQTLRMLSDSNKWNQNAQKWHAQVLESVAKTVAATPNHAGAPAVVAGPLTNATINAAMSIKTNYINWSI